MQLKKAMWFAVLLITAMSMTIIPSVSSNVINDLIDAQLTIDDPVSANLYTNPVCYSCVPPTPVKQYEVVGISISSSSTVYQLGKSVTLSATQTSGTPLGPNTVWSWDGVTNSNAYGQTVTITPTIVGKNKTIYVRVRDEENSLTGQATLRVTVLPRA